MPLYEYQCACCSGKFETYARTFNHAPDCPTCGGSDVTRLLSTFAVATGSHPATGAAQSSYGGCGEGPPCGAAQCGRLSN